MDSKCKCKPGYAGDDCMDRVPANCSESCVGGPPLFGHGDCVSGECVCRPGYHGISCELGCPGYSPEHGQTCSGHGLCAATGSPGRSPDRCKCHIGFSGEACESDDEGVTTCPRGCSGHGSCRHGRCTCDAAYAGHDCSIELRYGQFATLLHTWQARLCACLACFVLSTLVAALALRWINALDREAETKSQQMEELPGVGLAGLRKY